MTVGFYYAICGSWHLTQIKALANFPIYAALIAAVAATNTKNQKIAVYWLCLSGIAGGFVIICKLIFLPIVVCFWLTTLLVLAQRGGFAARTVTAATAAVAVGFALPLMLVAIYFARFGALEIVGYTFFEYPVRAVAAFADNNRRAVLDQGLLGSLRSFAPLLLLIMVAGLLAVPSPKTIRAAFANGSIRNLPQANLLTVNLILWLFAGFAVILAQRNSWWEYHYWLMFAPLGVLAAKSIETIWRRAAQISDFFINPVGQFAFAVCVGFLFVPTARLAIKKFDYSIVARVNSPPENLWTARGDQDEQYQTAAADIEFLSQPTARSGAIFVCGSPLYYHLSRRPPALASNGWMPELFLPAQWEQLAEELSAKLPQYVFVDNGCSNLIIQKSPRIVQLLADNYRVRSRSGKMSSYELAFEIGKTE